jgi:sulfur carrier protein ThiS
MIGPAESGVKVHVRILGALARPRGHDDLEIELAPHSRISDLLGEVGYSPQHQRFIVVAVNGQTRRHSGELTDRDEVTLLMPASGG